MSRARHAESVIEAAIYHDAVWSTAPLPRAGQRLRKAARPRFRLCTVASEAQEAPPDPIVGSHWVSEQRRTYEEAGEVAIVTKTVQVTNCA